MSREARTTSSGNDLEFEELPLCVHTKQLTGDMTHQSCFCTVQESSRWVNTKMSDGKHAIKTAVTTQAVITWSSDESQSQPFCVVRQQFLSITCMSEDH